MMTFKNTITGETMQVGNITMLQGRIFFSVRGKGCGTRFFNRNVCLTLDEQAENGTWLKVADGWELVPNTRKRKSAVAEPTATAEPSPEPTAEPTANEPASVPAIDKWNKYEEIKGKHPDVIPLFRCGDFYETYGKDADIVGNVCGITVTLLNGVSLAGLPHHALDTYLPKLIRAGHRVCICDEKQAEPTAEPTATSAPEPTNEPEPVPTPAPTAALDAIAEKYGQFGRDIAEALSGVIQPKNGGEDVRSIIIEELVKMTKEEPSKYRTLAAKLQPKKDGEDEEDELFEKILCMVKNDRIIGRYPWLYGPAGSGKSTIAQKVAERMGLPFYSVSSLLQKYELEGYTDAASRLLETSFFKAWTEGGVFCFDEASTSAPEVQVAINTAMAQLIYNFPKVGMTEAHKDFHFIAADNSTGRGGDKRYNSRFKLDASTLDRYTFVGVGYRQAHDMRMAEGDAELVTFIQAVRKAIDAGNTEYLASPRASRAIKALQAAGMTDEESLWFGLFSGWKKDDSKTIINSLTGSGKYFAVANRMLTKYCKTFK